MLRNSTMAPLDVTDKDWIIQSKLSYDDSQALKHVGRWAFAVPRKNLNEVWKAARKLYKNDELPNCKYLMTSTAADHKQKNGMILFFFEKSKEEQAIKETGEMLIEKLFYKAPTGITAIYYKSKTVSNGTRKFLYKIDLPSDESESD